MKLGAMFCDGKFKLGLGIGESVGFHGDGCIARDVILTRGDG